MKYRKLLASAEKSTTRGWVWSTGPARARYTLALRFLLEAESAEQLFRGLHHTRLKGPSPMQAHSRPGSPKACYRSAGHRHGQLKPNWSCHFSAFLMSIISTRSCQRRPLPFTNEPANTLHVRTSDLREIKFKAWISSPFGCSIKRNRMFMH